MRIPVLVRLLITAVWLLACARPAGAQMYETVGSRAQGMGGAFVAVADDATATWWNPAGLATGAYLSGVVEYDTGRMPKEERGADGQPQLAWRTEVRGLAVAYPALGISYYRWRFSQMSPGSVSQILTQNGVGLRPDEARLTTTAVSQYGMTVGQSIGDHLVFASTLKLLRGSATGVTSSLAGASLNAADALDGSTETHLDLDLGWMVTASRARLGLSVRNLREPAFGSGVDRVTLKRQARAGLAIGADTRGQVAGVTFAADVDLTRASTVTGDVRHVAAGVEAWAAQRRVSVRGGISANTVGDARPSLSGGASVGVKAGTFVDAYLTRGSDASRQGWGFAFRVAY